MSSTEGTEIARTGGVREHGVICEASAPVRCGQGSIDNVKGLWLILNAVRLVKFRSSHESPCAPLKYPLDCREEKGLTTVCQVRRGQQAISLGSP